MPGLICLLQKNPHQNFEYLLFYSCWRDGLRMGLKNLLDPNYSIIPELIKTVIENKIVYKYSTIDSSPLDMKDIMYWMIKEYQPIYNNVMDYEDTKRYKNIYVREMLMEDNDIRSLEHNERSGPEEPAIGCRPLPCRRSLSPIHYGRRSICYPIRSRSPTRRAFASMCTAGFRKKGSPCAGSFRLPTA